MKRMKTAIYDEFRCVADRCDFTCCREWKIAVDDSTYEKWKGAALTKHTLIQDGSRVIGLTDERLCPFLTPDSLCRLVLEHGDEMLSGTCRRFPREIHEFTTRTEYSLLPSCPAVLELIRESGSQVLEYPEDCEQASDTDPGTKKSEMGCDVSTYQAVEQEEKLFFAIRDFLMELMQDTELTVNQALLMNFYVLLDLLELDDEGELTMEAFEEYRNSGILQELYESIADVEFQEILTFEERNELLLDLSENYRKQGLYREILEPVCNRAQFYSKRKEKGSLEEETLLRSIRHFSKRIKKSEEFFRDFMTEKIFADCYTPESTFECMVVKLQWLAMEYGAMMQAIFLYEELQEEQSGKPGGLPKAYPFEDLKRMIVLIERMTGYEDDDIYEYLENSFEDLIWEWGYFALVVGE